MLDAGYSEEKAELYSAARIFGTKPGNLSGTNILYLVPRSGVWEDDSEITSVYIDSMSYVYVGDVWGEKVDGLYEQAIQGTDTLIRVWASNMTSQLSNHHAYEYLGGLNMAVKELTGKEPTALIADVRDPNQARIRSFEEVLDTTLRAELLNEDWIRGMKEHDYAGAGHMAELVKNTFGWDVTRDSAVSDAVWNDIYKTYIEGSKNLDLEQWFDRVNPHAMQAISATMMEAARKGYWSASEEQLNELAKRYAESVAKHGLSAGLVSGGNKKLEEALIKRLGTINAPALAETYSQAVRDSEGETSGSAKIYGAKMSKQETGQPAGNPLGDLSRQWWLYAGGGILLLLVGVGAWRRVGTTR
jgi:cobaltochelatase CobN